MVMETAPVIASQAELFAEEAEELELFDDRGTIQDIEGGSPVEVMPRLMDMDDKAILSLYEKELREYENTFAGILFSDEEKAELFCKLYGSKGYFIQVSHAGPHERRKP